MRESQSAALLEQCLNPLVLPTILPQYAKLASVCRANSPTCLVRLAERETQDREVRPTERRGQAARFAVVTPLDPFDVAAHRSINHEVVREPWQATTVLLDGHEHRRHVQVTQTDGTAYGALLALGGAP